VHVSSSRDTQRLSANTVKTLELLEINPHHPSIRLRPLKGKLAGLHSISINISYRSSLEMVISEQEIILVNIGTHDEVY